MRLRLLLACLIFTRFGFAAGLPPEIEAALTQTGIPDSHLGLVLQPLDAATPQLALGELRSLNPASVMKLVTTLATLDSLGPAHRWQTRVLYEGTIAHGILDGKLILQGGGDPSLTLERFWLLLRELRLRGIREIRGDILLDQSFYAIEPVDPGQFDQLPLKPYNAVPAALMVSQNALALRLAPNGDEVRAALDPALTGVGLQAQLDLDDRPCNGWQDGLELSLEGRALRLSGHYPSSCGERTLWLNLLPPDETVAEVFAALWRELGGAHQGRILAGPAPAAARPLFEFDSQPLALIARDINTYSNNVMAKMLLLNLGAARYGAPATWDKGARAIRAWLAEKRLEMPELVIENGAGLSRIERISAASLARLLVWAPQSPAYYAFAASLPVLGQNGTLKTRLKDSPYVGRAWLKSGSLNGVRNLAGYVLDAQGRRKVLVLLINHDKAETAAPVQEALIHWAMHVPSP